MNKIVAVNFSNASNSMQGRGIKLLNKFIPFHKIINLKDYNIPVLDSNMADGRVPECVIDFDKALIDADAYVFLVAEFMGGYCGQFKNAMDWLVVKSNMNNNLGTTYGFSKKPVFITTFTPSKKAGGRHFDMTKNLIEKMGGIVVGTKVFNDCWDNLIPSNDTFVENFCFEVNDFVRGYNGHEELEVKQWKNQSELTEKYNNWKKQWK